MSRARIDRARTKSNRPTSGPTIGNRRRSARRSISTSTSSDGGRMRRRYSSMAGLTMSMPEILARRIVPARRLRHGDLVVPHVGIHLEEEVAVLREVDRLVDIGPGERPDRVERLPQRDEQEPGPPVGDPPQDVDTPVSRGRPTLLHAGLLEILQVLIRFRPGGVPRPDSDEYLEYLEKTGVKECRATPGNRGVYVLRRVADGRAGVLFISLWEPPDAIRAFAGADIDKAVYFPEDRDFLLEMDPHVRHYEVAVAETTGRDDPAC